MTSFEPAPPVAAGRGPAPRWVVSALCWILGLPLIMGALIGMAYAIHGLALLCAWF